MNRRKTAAEAGSAVASGADEVVESTLKWARELRIDMATLKQRVAELETENAELKQTVREQGEMIRQLQAELEQYRAREECPD
jgi:predicted RNase H-like nuclease (RuvC/YqgF family)